MPYFTSAEVIGVPSSYFRPSFRVYVHTVASLLGRPVSVARSGTTSAPAAPSSLLRVVRVRKTSDGTFPPPEVYSRAGSKSCCGLEFRTVSVPPWCGVESPADPLASLSSGPQAAAPVARTTRTAATRALSRDDGRIEERPLAYRDRLTECETEMHRRLPGRMSRRSPEPARTGAWSGREPKEGTRDAHARGGRQRQ